MHLPSSVASQMIQTPRLNMHVFTSGAEDGVPLLLVHGNVSSSRFFAELLAALPERYRAIAPDLRGYGATETRAIDATRGVRDWSDDLHGLIEALGWAARPVHVLGWSMGAGVAMQYTIDRPAAVASLTLLSPISPCGFGGTRDIEGTLTSPDGAGSGGGAANPEFVHLLEKGEMGSDSPVAPRNVMNTFYFKPPFTVDAATEDEYVAAMNSTAIGEDHYPGDMTSSTAWPNVAPGTRGVLNTMAPLYFDMRGLAKIAPKPPILWIRGDSDQIVSDLSMFDLAALGQIGAVPGWPGDEVCPPQPMIVQTRALLERYAGDGGVYEEIVFADCAHAPHIEHAEQFVERLTAFIG